MDCEHCQRALLDVAYAECSPAQEAEMRAHMAGCASCSSDLAKIQGGLAFAASLPTLEPTARTTENILAQARAQALSVRALSQSPRGGSSSLADRIRVFLGQFAMGRQVAMATTMVLVVAVGLWFVPQARHQDLAVGHVVNPDPNGEAGPSDGIVPAAPLDLDLRQGRIRARSDEPERRRERPTVASAESLGPSEKESDRSQPEAKGSLVAEAIGVHSEAPSTEEAAPAALTDDSSAIGVADDLRGTIDVPSPAPEARTATSSSSGAGYGQGSGMSARKARSAPPVSLEVAEAVEATNVGAARPAAARPPTAPTARDSSEVVLTDPDAIAVPAEATESRGTDSLLALARTYQRGGRCDAAVVQYEAFLKRSPRHREAMLEAARCYQQLGRVADATRWTKRADMIAPAETSPSAAPAQPATSVQGQ